jgi:hypothetical protein
MRNRPIRWEERPLALDCPGLAVGPYTPCLCTPHPISRSEDVLCALPLASCRLANPAEQNSAVSDATPSVPAERSCFKCAFPLSNGLLCNKSVGLVSLRQPLTFRLSLAVTLPSVTPILA